jgi:hypothetical protein
MNRAILIVYLMLVCVEFSLWDGEQLILCREHFRSRDHLFNTSFLGEVCEVIGQRHGSRSPNPQVHWTWPLSPPSNLVAAPYASHPPLIIIVPQGSVTLLALDRPNSCISWARILWRGSYGRGSYKHVSHGHIYLMGMHLMGVYLICIHLKGI